MTAELGQFALLLAFAAALAQTVLPLWGVQAGRARWMALARPLAAVGFGLVSVALAALVTSFVQVDTSVAYVAANASHELPLGYRITATWGGHEGSLLLWVWILCAWGALVAARSAALPAAFAARVQGVLGAVAAGFLAFIAFTSNPFARLLPAPAEGRDLNPLLQDPGMAAHPPLLYLGYGFRGRLRLRGGGVAGGRARCALDALGAALGAGGLVGADGRHPARQLLGLLRAGLGWLLVLGRRRERGLHALAAGHGADPFAGRGREAPGLPALEPAAGAAGLLAVAAGHLPRALGRGQLGPRVRERPVARPLHPRAAGAVGGRLADAVRLARPPRTGHRRLCPGLARVAAAAEQPAAGHGHRHRAAGHPLPAGGRGHRRHQAVGRRALFRHRLPADHAAAGGAAGDRPLARWRVAAFSQLRPLLPLALAALASAGALALTLQGSLWMAAGVATGLWTLGGTLALAWRRRTAWRQGLPLWLAHAGVGVFILGVTLVRSLEQTHDLSLAPGEQRVVAGHVLRFDSLEAAPGPNYQAARARLTWQRGATPLLLAPEKRVYGRRQMAMTEAAIARSPWRDVYVSLGDADAAGRWALRLQIKPFMAWVWVGALLMAAGGLWGALAWRRRPRTEPAVESSPAIVPTLSTP